MDRLRAVFEGLGFPGVETFIASGNVIFETRSAGGPALARRIERALQKALGYEVATFIRTDEEVAEIARTAPFTKAQVAAARNLSVGLLEAPLDMVQVGALKKLQDTGELLQARGREVYWCSSLPQNESKFSNAVFERTTGVAATFRGMNTMRRLAAKYPSQRDAGPRGSGRNDATAARNRPPRRKT